ncbi:uroporphyrinogen decarboxylase family protein [Treponema sp.]
MTSRERVLHAFGKLPGKGDRVPLQFDLCRSLVDHFSKKLGIEADYALSYYEDLTYRISANAIRTRLGSDCIVVGGTVADGFKAKDLGNDTSLNEFGMAMRPTELYMEVVECPLKDCSSEEDLAAYSLPNPYAPGRFTAAERDIKRFAKDFFVIGDVELSLFELAWHLTGMEKYLMALAMEESWIEKLNDRVEEWTTGLALSLVSRGVDAIWLGEDLGTQNSMLISPDMWRDRFKSRYARLITKLKAANPEIIIIFHSDGAVAPLIEDFIELGVSVYNPVQPNVPGSDPQELVDKYGGKINFFGGIDQQDLLPTGDKKAIEAEIKRRSAILGANGGYLMAPAHIIQADVSPETVEFLCAVATSGGA